MTTPMDRVLFDAEQSESAAAKYIAHANNIASIIRAFSGIPVFSEEASNKAVQSYLTATGSGVPRTGTGN